MHRFAFALALVALVAAPALADEKMVHVFHDKLDPADVTIAVGDSVVFHNMVEMPGGHTVVADDGSFESPALAKDARYTHTFEKAGRYPFHVKQHPSVKGTVIVE